MSKILIKRTITSFALLALVLLMYLNKYFFASVLIFFGLISIVEFYFIVKKIFKKKIYLIISSAFFLTYIIILFLIFYLFSQLNLFKIILFYFLLICIVTDIGGFVFGKTLKGPKLTKISPNKTISGSTGSLVLSVVIGTILYSYYINDFVFKDYGIFIILTILISTASQLGDLFFSFLKRKAKIKDTGNFFPGHGGILDRLDGILLGVPTGLILVYIINYLYI